MLLVDCNGNKISQNQTDQILKVAKSHLANLRAGIALTKKAAAEAVSLKEEIISLEASLPSMKSELEKQVKACYKAKRLSWGSSAVFYSPAQGTFKKENGIDYNNRIQFVTIEQFTSCPIYGISTNTETYKKVNFSNLDEDVQAEYEKLDLLASQELVTNFKNKMEEYNTLLGDLERLRASHTSAIMIEENDSPGFREAREAIETRASTFEGTANSAYTEYLFQAVEALENEPTPEDEEEVRSNNEEEVRSNNEEELNENLKGAHIYINEKLNAKVGNLCKEYRVKRATAQMNRTIQSYKVQKGLVALHDEIVAELVKAANLTYLDESDTLVLRDLRTLAAKLISNTDVLINVEIDEDLASLFDDENDVCYTSLYKIWSQSPDRDFLSEQGWEEVVEQSYWKDDETFELVGGSDWYDQEPAKGKLQNLITEFGYHVSAWGSSHEGQITIYAPPAANTDNFLTEYDKLRALYLK